MANPASETAVKAARELAEAATRRAANHWLVDQTLDKMAKAATLEEKQAIWEAGVNAAMKSLQLGEKGFNLAPNAPNLVVRMPQGNIIKVPNKPGIEVPQGAEILNKSPAEVQSMFGQSPMYKGGWGSAERPAPAIEKGTSGIPSAGERPVAAAPAAAPAAPPPVAPAPPAGPNVGQGAVKALQDPYLATAAGGMGAAIPVAAMNGPYGSGGPGAANISQIDPMTGGPMPAAPQIGAYQRSGPLADRAVPEQQASPYYALDGGESSPTYGTQQYQPNEPRRFPTVARAVEMSKGRGSSPQMATTQTSPTAAAASDVLQSLIRGRFGEAGKGSPMDDRLTAFQEARDQSGEARKSGGAVGGKDQAIHKALEIIHHLISRR